MNYSIPFVLDETEDFAVVFKPPRMHSAPLRQNKGDTLLDWYAAIFPPVMDVDGRKAGEGGLLHRLDFETQGLVFFAKNNKTLSFLLTLQDEGSFIKEYSAICQKTAGVFPEQETFVIESFFRPFGPGRKQVRPVTEQDSIRYEKLRHDIARDKGGCYRTEVVNVIKDKYYAFTVRIKRGFRHQIRCHLAWIGCPVLNDPVYGAQSTDSYLALRSTGLFFSDPCNGRLREYRIPPLEMPADSM